jgi:GTP-binding protein
VATHNHREIVIADIPGLIAGAAEGAGIGDRFLGHIERCRVLLHLIDATGDNPVKAWRTVRKELDIYGAGLVDKPEVIGLNKIDALDPAEVKAITAKLKRATKCEIMPMSGAAGTGIEAVLDRLSDAIPMPEVVARAAGEVKGEWSPV